MTLFVVHETFPTTVPVAIRKTKGLAAAAAKSYLASRITSGTDTVVVVDVPSCLYELRTSGTGCLRRVAVEKVSDVRL